MPIKVNTTKINVPLKTYEQNWKIVYIDDSGTEQILGDASNNDYNRVLNGSFNMQSLRYGIGSFSLSLLNDNGFFNSTLTKGMRIKVSHSIS